MAARPWRGCAQCRNPPGGAHSPGRETMDLQSLHPQNWTSRHLAKDKHLKGSNPFLQSRQWRLNLELRGSIWTAGTLGQTFNLILYRLTFKFGTLVRMLLRTSFHPSISGRWPERPFLVRMEGPRQCPHLGFSGSLFHKHLVWELQFLFTMSLYVFMKKFINDSYYFCFLEIFGYSLLGGFLDFWNGCLDIH